VRPGTRMDATVRRRPWRLTTGVLVALLATPTGAQAHLGSGIVATDYRATHGIVLAALPANAARASVVIALWSGTAAILAGGWLWATSVRPGTEPASGGIAGHRRPRVR
jgi:cytochrome b